MCVCVGHPKKASGEGFNRTTVSYRGSFSSETERRRGTHCFGQQNRECFLINVMSYSSLCTERKILIALHTLFYIVKYKYQSVI